MWFLNRLDTNQVVQSQKMARGWKFWFKKVVELYYPCNKNKDAYELGSYCTADQVSLFLQLQNVGFLMVWLICPNFGIIYY